MAQTDPNTAEPTAMFTEIHFLPFMQLAMFHAFAKFSIHKFTAAVQFDFRSQPHPRPSFSLLRLSSRVRCAFRLVRLLLRLVLPTLPLGFVPFSPAFSFLFLGLTLSRGFLGLSSHSVVGTF